MSSNLSYGLSEATNNGSQFGAWGTGIQKYSMASPSTPSVSGPSMPGVAVNSPTTGVNQAATGAQAGQGSGFWSKDGGAGMVLGGIQVLGNLWSSYQAHKMAKEQMSFAREQWDTNLHNQTQTYNTALEDRIRSRHHTEGRGTGETDAYLAEHSL